ncbi:MAG: glycosyl hydrolase [Planctomycetota bacterium]
MASLAGEAKPDSLAQGFLDPPQSAKPWVYWWWLESNVTKEGITLDLEEMKRQGIGGAMVFDAGMAPTIPPGPTFMGPEWRELFKFAAEEANRVGLELSVNLCSGWDCGGPWVTPEHASKKLVFSETQVTGPHEFSEALPLPPVVDGYYHDVAVVAFNSASVTGASRMDAARPKITASSTYQDYTVANAVDGDPQTRWVSNGGQAGQGPSEEEPEFVLFEFDKPFEAASLYVAPNPDYGPRQCQLQTSKDGETFETVSQFTMAKDVPETVPFDEVRSRIFRLVITSSYSFGSTEGTWNVQITGLQLLAKGEPPKAHSSIKHWAIKSGNQGLMGMPRGVQHERNPEVPGEVEFESRSLIDLSSSVTDAGRLVWNVPEGDWSIFRFGHTLLGGGGSRIKCTSPGGHGLEVDYLSTDAIDMHFAAMAEKLIADVGPLAGRTVKYFHDDSWEVGHPNWTAKFREEFKRRRGYDLLPYLPVLAGKIVDSRDVSNRFLWDIRRTIGDLIAENHYGRLNELSKHNGIGTHPEAGGPFFPNIDALANLGRSDIPMGEFWAKPVEPDGEPWWWNHYHICDTIKQAASAAHVYGKRLCQAEAFTTMGPNWEKDFFMLKDVGDLAFCQGLTRNMLCFYVHQPRLDIKPGYQWEAAGTHFDRNVTWWPQIHAWLDYLTRCQFLLQQGLFVADVLYFNGEDIPNFVPAKWMMEPALPPGYDCDTANAEVLLGRTSVEKGRIVLPDGMSYRLLVLPERETMSPHVLRKITELVEAGATVVGPKPSGAPGLTDYPDCDRVVKELADKAWGPCDGKTVKEHTFGKGRVIWGKTLEEILLAHGAEPDFQVAALQGDAKLDYVHRTCPEAEIYFVSNQRNRVEEADCSFRVSGKAPQLWMPDTGEIRRQVVYQTHDGRTTLPLRLDPRGSVFVVFREPAHQAPVVSLAKDGSSLFPNPKRAADARLAVEVLGRGTGQIQLRISQPGRYELSDADGKTAAAEIEAVPTPQRIPGPWKLAFPKGWGAPAETVLDELLPWNEHPQEGIRYFSGTATYRNVFDLRPDLNGKVLTLDLGKLKNVAEVRLNGHDLGVLWKPPFQVEITGTARPGRNELEIGITNLWPNRLIGDGKLPETNRFTKTNVQKFYQPPQTGEHQLLESGLMGPVRILATEELNVSL